MPHLCQIRDTSVHHRVDGTEAVEQLMRNFVCVNPWNHVIQQQFQHLMIVKRAQTISQKTLLHSTSMSVMQSFFVHSFVAFPETSKQVF